MSAWVYKEGKTIRFYFYTIFLSGLFFLLFVLFNLNPFYEFFPWAIVITALCIWLLLGAYEYFNIAAAIYVEESSISVEWVSSNKKEYSIDSIEIKKIGFKSEFLCLTDDKWKVMNYRIPRILLLDGFSAEHKELLKNIREIIDRAKSVTGKDPR